MSNFISALFGKKDDHHDEKKKKHQQKVDETISPGRTVVSETVNSASTASGDATSHTAVSDDVHVHSHVRTQTNTSVSTQNSDRINALLQKLGTTHEQADAYSKRKMEAISAQEAKAIEAVVADTRAQQDALLFEANGRTRQFEEDYRAQLQAFINQMDAEKAVQLDALAKEMQASQEAILEQARRQIDAVNGKGNQDKIALLKAAQAQTNVQINQITDKITTLAQEDAQNRLQSTSTTVITTQAASSSEHHAEVYQQK